MVRSVNDNFPARDFIITPLVLARWNNVARYRRDERKCYQQNERVRKPESGHQPFLSNLSEAELMQ
jgi:hypothetical protein